MVRILCQLVPTLVLGGCFGSHGVGPGAPVDGGETDTHTPPILVDSGAMEDATSPGMCPTGLLEELPGVPIDRVCHDGAVPPGAPFSLSVYIDRCTCIAAVTCAARITGPFELSLDTGLCEHPDVDCDGCAMAHGRPSVEGHCELPPLDAGTWTVSVNGAPGFELLVADAYATAPTCTHVAPRVEGPLICDFPGTQTGPQVCHDAEARGRTAVEIRVTDPCGDCFGQAGDCTVTLGPGNALHVTAHARQCSCPVCGACAAICVEQTTLCHTPPLAPGTYEVIVGTTRTRLLVVGGAIPRPGVTCAGVAP